LSLLRLCSTHGSAKFKRTFIFLCHCKNTLSENIKQNCLVKAVFKAIISSVAYKQLHHLGRGLISLGKCGCVDGRLVEAGLDFVDYLRIAFLEYLLNPLYLAILTVSYPFFMAAMNSANSD